MHRLGKADWLIKGCRLEKNSKMTAVDLAAKNALVAPWALLTAALVWGLIWYPYRILRDAGFPGLLASALTYSIALLLGLLLLRRRAGPWRPSWELLWLGVASAGCNLGYVLATLHGEVVRVLLLFYLAPLWTVLLSRLLLGERLCRVGAAIIALSLAGAFTLLWRAGAGLPIPQDLADWFGLGAGFFFALYNVLSRRVNQVSIEQKSLVAFAGAALCGLLLAFLLGEGTALWQGLAAGKVPAAFAWGILLLVGAVLVVVNLVAQFGLTHTSANRAIVIMLAEVGFAAVSSWLLAGETMGPREWLGGAMIVTASLFSSKVESG